MTFIGQYTIFLIALRTLDYAKDVYTQGFISIQLHEMMLYQMLLTSFQARKATCPDEVNDR